MSDEPFLKCPCQNCGDSIEFPAQGVGLTIECPHCGRRTVLKGSQPAAASPPVGPMTNPPPGPEPAPHLESAKSRSLILVAALFVFGALAGGAFWYFKAGPGKQHRVADSEKNPSQRVPPRATNESLPEDTTNTAVTPTIDKSIDDLKPGAVSLEKAKSGNLMYAVGTVKNDSPHQRFGVKVEIEFTDAKGRPAGKTSDYTQVIEPGKEWRFRALVLDSKAAIGKVVGMKEDH